MKNVKVKCTNKVENEQRGSVTFQETTKDKNKTGIIVAVQFDDPKEVSKFEIKKEYTITIT